MLPAHFIVGIFLSEVPLALPLDSFKLSELQSAERRAALPGEDPNWPDTLGGYFPLAVPRQADFRKADCFTFSPLQGTPIVVCRPESDGWIAKVSTIAPTVAVSIVALVISLRALRYTQSKDQRARNQSVKDDYWLRKVASPASVEPFVAFSSDLMMKLPPVAGSALTADAESLLMDEQLGRVRSFSVLFNSLKVVSFDLVEEVRNHIGSFEDILVTYKFERENFLKSGGEEPSRLEAIEELSKVQHDVLSAIQRHQAALS